VSFLDWSTDEMVAMLKYQGWQQLRIGLWKAPWGAHFRGPAQAHRVMMQVLTEGLHGSRIRDSLDPKRKGSKSIGVTARKPSLEQYERRAR
jgi:hypothetical protein